MDQLQRNKAAWEHAGKKIAHLSWPYANRYAELQGGRLNSVTFARLVHEYWAQDMQGDEREQSKGIIK